MRHALCLLALALVGCSSRSDRTTAPPAAALARFPVFERALSSAAPLDRVARGFESRFAVTNGAFARPTGAVRVTFPEHADGATRIESFVDSALFVEVRPKDLAHAPAHVEGNVLRMRDASSGVEEVLFASLERVEEVRVLPRAASTELVWQLAKGPHVSTFRVRDDVVEVLDREGRVRLQTEPMFAVDANGTKVALHPTLVRNELRVRVDARDLVAPIAVDPAWVATAGPLPYPNYDGVATMLPSGKVLVSGGYSSSTETVNAATYDPATDTWKLVGTMKAGRRDHILLALPTGNAIAISGGSGVSTAEIYDAATETWSFVAPLTYARSAPSGALLASGKILVAGGGPGTSSSTLPAELYDPSTDKWTLVRPPFTSRSSGVAAQLPSGKVGFVNSLRAEIYDPSTNTWALGTEPLFDHTGEGFAYANGFFYAFGHTGSTKNSEIERFDPTTLTWTHVARMPQTPNTRVHVVPLSSGKLLSITGAGSTSTSTSATTLFDPGTGTAIAAGNTVAVRANGGAIALPGDKVLMFGGSSSLTAAEIWSRPTAALGTACTENDDCASLRCVDGVCCNTACSTECWSCKLTGKEGTCSPLDGVDPRGACAGDCTVGCSAGVCAYKGSGTACGTESCDAGKLEKGTCSGVDDNCIYSKSTCAGGYTCQDTTACRTKCLNATECVTGPCDLSTGICTDYAVDAGPDTGAPDTGPIDTGAPDTGPIDTGAPDTGPLDTGTIEDTSIVDTGVAEDTSPSIDAVAPVVPENEAGIPIAPPATELQRCTTGADCATGFCADGVCCDRPCTERCHSCALPSSPGRCTPTPAGVDPRMECGPPLDCIGTCDGRGYCTGATKGTQCARSQCTGPAKGVGAAYCSAPGARCQTLTAAPFECAPFGCDPVFGACHSRCASSEQCAPGFVCDVPSQTCVEPAAPAEEGCSVAGAPGRAAPATAWLGIVAVVIALRHRRRVASALVALVALTGVGCSARSEPPVDKADELLATMRTFPAIAPRVPASGVLVRAGDHFRLAVADKASPFRIAGAPALDVQAAASADGETVIGAARDPDVWISVRVLEDRAVSARVAHAAVMYERVARDTDAMWFVARDRAEELRLLRTSRAATRATYKIALGPGVEDVRLVGERLEVVDRSGRVRIATEPAFAVDARNVRRPLRLALTREDRIAALATDFDATGLQYPIAVDPTFVALPNSAAGHVRGRGVLAGGKALFVGGRTGSTVHSTVEAYDPATDTWSTLAPMLKPREDFAMVQLSSGDLIVAGGGNATDNGLSTVERYDAATNTWKNVASMTYRRYHANGVLLDDGRMLVVGGGFSCGLFCGATYSQAETYDPSTDTWAAAGAMQIGRNEPQVAKLKSGKVIVVHDAGNTRTHVDLFSPTTNSWTIAAPMLVGRRELVSGMLPSGKFAVFAGAFAGQQADVYDETTDTWKRVADSVGVGDLGTSWILPSGKVFIASTSFDNVAAALYDEVADKYTPAGSFVMNHTDAPSVMLPSGQVVVTGAGATNAAIWSPPAALGAVCVVAGDCQSGFCVDGVCCSTTSCAAGSSCANPCAAGTCTKKSGQTCTSASECGTGFCVDGVCCTSACTDACRSCSLLSSRGVCAVVADGAADPHGACPDGPCASCSAGACVRKPAGASCGNICVGATLVVGTCQSDGACKRTETPCPGALKCYDAKRCISWGCSTNADCTTGSCVSGSCDVTTEPDAEVYDIAGYDLGLPPADTSATDTTPSDGTPSDSGPVDSDTTDATVSDTSIVIDSTVVDSTVDDTASSDGPVAEDVSVAAPEFDGGAPKLPASIQRCARDEECATGHCADGVCCDTACGERCHSCATLDAPGKCTVLPAGVDLRGECGPIGTCVATCNGAGACVGAGKGTQCAQQRCTGKSKGVGPAFCAGKGAPCPLGDGLQFECAPYVCEPLFGACTSTCTKSSECADGHVCDAASKQCVPIAPPPDDEGGCSTSSRPTRGHAGSMLFALGALYAMTRKYRRRA